MRLPSHRHVNRDALALALEVVGDAGSEPRILDLGCGDGAVAVELARVGAHVTGVDISPVAVERARAANPELEFVVVSADEALPFADAAFDAVVCLHVLEHVADTQHLLSEARRVLAPGAGSRSRSVPRPDRACARVDLRAPSTTRSSRCCASTPAIARAAARRVRLRATSRRWRPPAAHALVELCRRGGLRPRPARLFSLYAAAPPPPPGPARSCAPRATARARRLRRGRRRAPPAARGCGPRASTAVQRRRRGRSRPQQRRRGTARRDAAAATDSGLAGLQPHRVLERSPARGRRRVLDRGASSKYGSIESGLMSRRSRRTRAPAEVAVARQRQRVVALVVGPPRLHHRNTVSAANGRRRERQGDAASAPAPRPCAATRPASPRRGPAGCVERPAARHPAGAEEAGDRDRRHEPGPVERRVHAEHDRHQGQRREPEALGGPGGRHARRQPSVRLAASSHAASAPGSTSRPSRPRSASVWCT